MIEDAKAGILRRIKMEPHHLLKAILNEESKNEAKFYRFQDKTDIKSFIKIQFSDNSFKVFNADDYYGKSKETIDETWVEEDERGSDRRRHISYRAYNHFSVKDCIERDQDNALAILAKIVKCKNVADVSL